jgi:hypothetical protein
MSVDAVEPRLAKIDLHGYRPRDFVGPPMTTIVEQAWDMGADKLRFIHGHGRARGKSPGFYNTKTGWLGLRIRRELRRNRALRRWIKYTTLDCSHWGQTTVKLKANPNPTRRELDPYGAAGAELSAVIGKAVPENESGQRGTRRREQ